VVVADVTSVTDSIKLQIHSPKGGWLDMRVEGKSLRMLKQKPLWLMNWNDFAQQYMEQLLGKKAAGRLSMCTWLWIKLFKVICRGALLLRIFRCAGTGRLGLAGCL